MSVSSCSFYLRRAATLVLACSVLRVVVAQGQGRYPGEDDERGRQQVQEQVNRFGRVQNPAENQMVRRVLDRLIPATHLPGLQVQFAIVNDTREPNAFATFGGWVVVKQALFNWFRQVARRTSGGQRQTQRVEQMLSAVLAHELAHVTLGHLDEQPAPNEREAQFITRLELQADQQGALYLSASRGDFQWMVDLVQALDQLDGPGIWQPWALNYFRDHPRGSLRAAELLKFKYLVLVNQSRFDDAITHVNGNFQLEVAIEELDSILTDFPTLLPALHLRATAYHYLWLKTVSREQQQLRVVLPIYVGSWTNLVRGAPGNLQILQRARADYQAVLQERRLPYTLSNLALIEAYEGNLDQALQHAREALDQASGDPFVLNNAGVVLFLGNDLTTAARAFSSAIEAAGQTASHRVPVEFLFNLGKTLHRLGEPAAEQYLLAYVQRDQGTDWRREAEAMLTPSAGAGAAPQPPAAQPGAGGAQPQPRAAAGATVPTPGGVALGFSADQVVAALGPPSATHELGNGMQRMVYQGRGLAFAVHSRSGVCIIYVGAGYSGDVDGVRAGDRLSVVDQRWGQPSGTAEDGTRVYDRGSWAALVVGSGNVIMVIAVVPREALGAGRNE